jgi:hypothetical protein
MGRVIPILVRPLLCHSLLTLPLEAKLILVTIFPTIVTMKLYGIRLRLGMGLLTWFLSTRLLNRFSSLGSQPVSPHLPSHSLSQRTLPQSAHELDRILEIVGLWTKHGWSWGCV